MWCDVQISLQPLHFLSVVFRGEIIQSYDHSLLLLWRPCMSAHTFALATCKCFFYLTSFPSSMFVHLFLRQLFIKLWKKIGIFCGWRSGKYCCGWIERKGKWEYLEKQVVSLNAWLKTCFVSFLFLKHLITFIT